MQTVQIIFYTLVFLIIFEWLFMMILDYLNIKSVSVKLPKEAKDIYDEKEYKKSIEYEKTKFKFGFFSGTFSFLLMLICVLF
ncbi:MAG: hypothetical protein LBU14_04365 [Candidatus Peribacteria bacterium]|jgi:STE24 endopeptidase|nr:hypothetical protein [Candidatus Peribacteria bacterium]